MVDQPAVAVTPPVAAPETMVRVKVDHQERLEPLSKVVASYQTQSAAEKRFAEANAILTSRKTQVEFAETFQQHARANPEAALEWLRGELERTTGRPIKAPGSSAASNDGGDGLAAGGDPASNALIARIENRMHALETVLQAERQTRGVEQVGSEIQKALDQYPTFTGDAAKNARASLEMALHGMKAANPNIPISDLASELHAGIQGLMTGQATTQHTQLTTQAKTLAGVPATAGSPGLTEREAPPTLKSVKEKGGVRAALEEFTGNFQRSISANAR